MRNMGKTKKNAIRIGILFAIILLGFFAEKIIFNHVFLKKDVIKDAVLNIEEASDAKFVMEALYDPFEEEYGLWEESRFPPDQVLKRYSREGLYYKKIDGVPEIRKQISWDAYRFYDESIDPSDVDNEAGDNTDWIVTLYDVNDNEYVGINDGKETLWYQRR